MSEMRHGKPTEDEFGVNAKENVFPSQRDTEETFRLQEESLNTDVPRFTQESRNEREEILGNNETAGQEPVIPAFTPHTDTQEVVRPIISKKPERNKVKERSLRKEKTVNKEKKRMSRSALVLIAGIIIIAIPVLIFAGILGISALQTGSPRIGSRFDGDLQPAITDKDLTELKTELSAIGSVEDVEVILSQGQLKVFIDANDSLSEEQIDSILMSAYNKVTAKLPIGTYFTGDDSRKMYDLHIHVYTSADASAIGDENGRQYKLLHKNSTEETYGIDDMAHPKDPALAAELEGLTPEPVEEETEEGDGE
ncbi:MAG: hypothetical protein J5365_08465 [Erysipelotrichaceae bacterium]|nr:hypothetical protein [Erysipelotrichaceae bacterium]